MSANSEDNQLRDLFAGLKQADGRTAPDFATDCSAAADRTRISVFAQLRYGRLAAAVLIVAGLAALLSHEWTGRSPIAVKVHSTPPSKIDNNTDAVPGSSLETWKSPTAFLLSEPDEPDQNLSSPLTFPATQPRPRQST